VEHLFSELRQDGVLGRSSLHKVMRVRPRRFLERLCTVA
jgi:hypothetical protein